MDSITNRPKKAVIVVPFWREVGNVGNNRIDRFRHWLADIGFEVVIIRAGRTDELRSEPWGRELTIRDPLGIHRDLTSEEGIKKVPLRKPNRLRRATAYSLFNPEPSIVWARRAARHPLAQKVVKGAAFLLSSNPPESAHIAAWTLSRFAGIPHLVDMRDGWLDEPLRPALRDSALRRWRERPLEAKVFRDAGAILVTSEIWKELLCNRYPALAAKVVVLTNGYPRINEQVSSGVKARQNGAEVTLIHAGQFSGSDLRRTPALLLEPLLQNLMLQPARGIIKFIGPLTPSETDSIGAFRSCFESLGWRIECAGRIPRQDLLELLPKADGLLVLSTSFAGLPAKLFEYIPTLKPMFVVTQKGSATWRLCNDLPQATLAEPETGGSITETIGGEAFFAIRDGCAPLDFSESYLAERFKVVLEQIC